MARTCARVCVAPDVSPRNLYVAAGRAVPATRSRNVARAASTFLSLSSRPVSYPPPYPFIVLAAERSAFRAKRHWNRVSRFYSLNNNSEFMRDRSLVPTSVVRRRRRGTDGRLKNCLDPKNRVFWSWINGSRAFCEGHVARRGISRARSPFPLNIRSLRKIIRTIGVATVHVAGFGCSACDRLNFLSRQQKNVTTFLEHPV